MAHRSDGRAPRRSGDADRAVIRPGERVTIVGTAGSGKSTLLRHLIRRYSRAVLIDYKGDDPIPDWFHTRGAHEFEREFPRQPRIVAQAEPFADDLEWFDRVCRRAFAIGAVAVGLDDLPPDLTIGGKRSPGLEGLYKLGRSRQVTTLGCIQRPMLVPLVMLSEASHLFVFRLQLAGDRRRIEEITGPLPAPRSEHGFVWWRPGEPPVECAPL